MVSKIKRTLFLIKRRYVHCKKKIQTRYKRKENKIALIFRSRDNTEHFGEHLSKFIHLLIHSFKNTN